MKIFPRVLPSDTRGRDPSLSARKRHSEKRLLPRVPAHGTRGRGHLPQVLEHGTWGRHFSFFWQTVPSKDTVKCEFPFVSVPLPRVLYSGKKALPECHPSLSVMGFAAVGKASLPRVQHSGKIGFPECPIFGTRGRVWHSGNFSSPVVCYGVAARGRELRGLRADLWGIRCCLPSRYLLWCCCEGKGIARIEG
jgi:hypothetical protein